LDVTPYPGFDFHPDARGLIRPAADLATIEHPSGYPLGQTTQLYVVRQAFEAFGRSPDPTLIMRSLSLVYGVLTVLLGGMIGRALTGSIGVGLLTALFLALAPMHVFNSHFGTADSALVFFLYLSLLFGWRTLRHRRDLDFLLFVASVGVALAVKFFIPLLFPLAIVTWHQPRRLEKALEGALVLAGSFSVASFFNYTPWDLARLFEMIRFDNLEVVDGRSPLGQVAMYSWETVVALGIGTWLCFALGLAVVVVRGWRRRPRLGSLGAEAWSALTRSPWVVPASALGLHVASLVAADYHAPRHLLPLVPAMCFVAALGFIGARARLGGERLVAGVTLVLVVTYQVYNAIGTEARYRNDIRNPLAAAVAEVAGAGGDVVTFSEYTLVRGARFATAEESSESRPRAAFFATCDMEYNRYFGSEDADEVFHPYGGQSRLDFYRDLFADRLGYRRIFEVSRTDFTLEQRLASRGVLPSPGWFSPSHCVLFEDTGEIEAQGL